MLRSRINLPLHAFPAHIEGQLPTRVSERMWGDTSVFVAVVGKVWGKGGLKSRCGGCISSFPCVLLERENKADDGTKWQWGWVDDVLH